MQKTVKLEEIPDDLKLEMLKHNHYDQSNIVEHYNEAAEKYEQVYLTAGYHDPEKCAEVARDLFREEISTALVLDMGCGTGLCGKYLTDFGFTHIDGIDASSGMLEQAKSKNVYNELIEMFLGKPETYPAKFHNKYDVITATGILA